MLPEELSGKVLDLVATAEASRVLVAFLQSGPEDSAVRASFVSDIAPQKCCTRLTVVPAARGRYVAPPDANAGRRAQPGQRVAAVAQRVLGALGALRVRLGDGAQWSRSLNDSSRVADTPRFACRRRPYRLPDSFRYKAHLYIFRRLIGKVVQLGRTTYSAAYAAARRWAQEERCRSVSSLPTATTRAWRIGSVVCECLHHANLEERSQLIDEVVWTRTDQLPSLLVLLAQAEAAQFVQTVLRCADPQQQQAVRPGGLQCAVAPGRRFQGASAGRVQCGHPLHSSGANWPRGLPTWSACRWAGWPCESSGYGWRHPPRSVLDCEAHRGLGMHTITPKTPVR